MVSVDHPLDERIPLDPSRIGKYLEFVKLWIGSMYYLLRRSKRRDIGAFVDYVDAIRDLYADAGSVYRRVHTTTARPSGNCVPSLHILIVVSNWKIALATAERIGQGRELGPWLDRLRLEAVAITESVLFVKQHSLNCVGVSLYYLRRRYLRLSAAEVPCPPRRSSICARPSSRSTVDSTRPTLSARRPAGARRYLSSSARPDCPELSAPDQERGDKCAGKNTTNPRRAKPICEV